MRSRGRKIHQLEKIISGIATAITKTKEPTTKKSIAQIEITIVATSAIERKMSFTFLILAIIKKGQDFSRQFSVFANLQPG
jgi:hypothetical protein